MTALNVVISTSPFYSTGWVRWYLSIVTFSLWIASAVRVGHSSVDAGSKVEIDGSFSLDTLGKCSRRHGRLVIRCHAIKTEALFFAELANQDLGESQYKSNIELSVQGHPFSGHLTSRVFNFTYDGQNFYFSRLEVLKLTTGSLNSVESDAFNSFCAYLVHVDLSLNRLRLLPLTALTHCAHKLQILNLSGNLIEVIYPIRGIPSLRQIDLSNNSVHSLEPLAFSSKQLRHLTRINLHKNYLRTIRSSSVDLFGKNSQSSTSPSTSNTRITLEISDNPLHCDCALRWLVVLHGKEKMYHRPFENSQLSFGLVHPICESPNPLMGQTLNLVQPLDLVCEPVIRKFSRTGLELSRGIGSQSTPSSTVVRAYEGDRLELRCLVSADPRPRIWWTFKDSVTIGKTLVDQLTSGRYTINTSALDEGGLNLSSTLTIDQLQLSDSGQIRCVAAFSPMSSFPALSSIERNETCAESFDVQIHSRHYQVRSSNMWIVLIICSSSILLFICGAILLWLRCSTLESGPAEIYKSSKIGGGGGGSKQRKRGVARKQNRYTAPTTKRKRNNTALSDQDDEGDICDERLAQVPVVDLGPPMYLPEVVQFENSTELLTNLIRPDYCYSPSQFDFHRRATPSRQTLGNSSFDHQNQYISCTSPSAVLGCKELSSDRNGDCYDYNNDDAAAQSEFLTRGSAFMNRLNENRQQLSTAAIVNNHEFLTSPLLLHAKQSRGFSNDIHATGMSHLSTTPFSNSHVVPNYPSTTYKMTAPGETEL